MNHLEDMAALLRQTERQRDDALARLSAAETERDELKAIVVRGNVWDTAEQNRILGAEARVKALEAWIGSRLSPAALDAARAALACPPQQPQKAGE